MSVSLLRMMLSCKRQIADCADGRLYTKGDTFNVSPFVYNYIGKNYRLLLAFQM